MQPQGIYNNIDSQHTVLELYVKNHPGTMSHICGLFSRRSFNLDGILCLPNGSSENSRIWLRVERNSQLDQVVKQLNKLADVCTVKFHDADHEVFEKLEDYFGH